MSGENAAQTYQEPVFLYTGKRRVYFAWINWALALSAVLLQFILQMSAGVIIDEVSETFSLTAFNAGMLSGAYYYPYVLLQIPAGLMTDRFGARRLLFGGGIVLTLSCYYFATSQHILVAELARFSMGIGSCFSFVSTLYLVQQWFPANRYAFMVGLTEMIALFGTIVGELFVAKLVKHWGWRHSMMVITWIALAIALLCGLFIRDKPYIAATHYDENPHPFRKSFQEVVRNTTCWLNGLYCGLMYAVETVFIALWAVPFYMQKYGLDKEKATLLTVMVFLGAALGSPFVGALSERLQTRRTLLIIGALLTLLMMVVVVYVDMSLPMLFFALFMLGVFSSAYVLSFVLLSDVVPSASMSTAVGFTNMLCVASAPLLQPAIGLALSLLATGVSGVGFSYYTTAHFQKALVLLPIILFIAAGVAYLMRETYTQKAVPETS